MSGNNHEIESLDQTVLRVGDADLALTLDDARRIQVALLDYLKQSNSEDRDGLIGWTKGSVRIDSQGGVRIGPWVLGSNGKDVFLRYREPPGQIAAKAHKAYLIQQDGAWTVDRLAVELITVLR